MSTSLNSLPLLGSTTTDGGPSSIALQGYAYVVNAVGGTTRCG